MEAGKHEHKMFHKYFASRRSKPTRDCLVKQKFFTRRKVENILRVKNFHGGDEKFLQIYSLNFSNFADIAFDKLDNKISKNIFRYYLT